MNNMIRFASGVALFFLLLAIACTKGGAPTASRSPEDTVKEFINVSSSAKVETDKKKLETLCSGEMRRALERMTDENFRISYLNSDLKIKEIKILESKSEKESATVRYQLELENKQGTDTTTEIMEREVDLALQNGAWLIESIRLKGTDKIAFTSGMIF